MALASAARAIGVLVGSIVCLRDVFECCAAGAEWPPTHLIWKFLSLGRLGAPGVCLLPPFLRRLCILAVLAIVFSSLRVLRGFLV